MRKLRFPVPCVLLLLSVTAFSQAANDADKEKQAALAAIVEQVIADIPNLKLPENRAVFYAQAGNLIWPQDEKRARYLFEGAATELLNAQAYAESNARVNPYSELLTGGSTRQQILNTIASRDAKLALSLMARTRPFAIRRAIAEGAARPSERSVKISDNRQNDTYLLQNESNLEQNFYRMAADQDPEHAVSLLKESLTKSLSSDTYNQLQRLAEKDASAAADLGRQIMSKLISAHLMADGQPVYPNIQVAQAFLNNYIGIRQSPGNKLNFDDGQMHDLAAKVVSTVINDQKAIPYMGSWAVTIAEKFVPSSLEQIKALMAANTSRSSQPNDDLNKAYQNLLANDTPPDVMLENADKYPLDMRRQIYQSASNKFLGQGNAQAARAVLSENFSDQTRDQLLTNFDMQQNYNLIGQGKFAEAERVIDMLPVEQRVNAYVNLANSVLAKDPKTNRTQAMAILVKAHLLVNDDPANSTEMGQLMQLIQGYANLAPDEGERLYEGLVPKMNELVDATAVINGFQPQSNVRQNEFVITQGDPLGNFGGNSNVIGQFARADLPRTLKLIDSFTRPEIRISLRLQMANTAGFTQLQIISTGRRTAGFVIEGQ